MKKLSIFLAAVATILVSCNNDEIIDQQEGVAINFGKTFVDNGSRSISDPSLTAGNFDFAVYGYMDNSDNCIFNKQKVEKDGSYSPVQYWTVGHQYIFGAAAPYTNANWELVKLEIPDFTDFDAVEFSFTNNGTQDFMVAKTSADATTAIPTEAVGFTFTHTLSKVKFSFENGFASNSPYEIEVKNVKITDAYVTGVMYYDMIEDELSWGNQADETLTLEFGDAVSSDTDTAADRFAPGEQVESYKELLLIPSPATKSYTVTFTATIYNGNVEIVTKDFTVTISGVELFDEYCYDFKAVLNQDNVFGGSESEIKFSVVGVGGWGNYVNNDVTVQ